MRRRKVKGADEKLLSYKEYVVRDNIESLKGNWNQLFKNDNPIHAEFGTGRGKFLTTLAKQNPDINYIAFEIKEEVLLKAVEKADRDNLKNIVFVWADVSKALDYFDSNELSRVYINFCDPWPKAKHAKRRLTYHTFLDRYARLLKDNGEVHFKTDNEDLFIFSLEEFKNCGWELKNVTYDLHSTDLPNVKTEYEEKFSAKGQPIFRVEAVIPAVTKEA